MQKAEKIAVTLKARFFLLQELNKYLKKYFKITNNIMYEKILKNIDAASMSLVKYKIGSDMILKKYGQSLITLK